jgi:arylsulfatase A-like enzyme
LTDDQRADCLGCQKHPLLKTPHIDALADKGVLFENACVTTAICCVSRASIMTGRYARNHRVPDFQTPLPKDVLAESFLALLKQLGYWLGCFGKWGIGGGEPAGLFDVWDAQSAQGPFFRMVDGEKVHDSEWLTRKVRDFLAKRPKDRPFCVVVCYKSPHEPYLPDPRDAELFKDAVIVRPKTFTEEHFKKLPAVIHPTINRTWLTRDCPTPEKYEEFVRQYLRCVAGVDRSIGAIVADLEKHQLTGRTLVLYTSDHGMFLGEHGLVGKWLMHEESIRVPLIVRYPGLPPQMQGKRLKELVLNIDIAPTLLDFAGAKVPKGMDGRSLRPLLLGRPVTWRQDFFYEHHFHNKGTIARTEGVRTQDWAYMTYFDVKPPPEELYDLRRDPLQEHNLAADLDHRQQLEAMRTLYRRYVEALPPAVLPNPPKEKK